MISAILKALSIQEDWFCKGSFNFAHKKSDLECNKATKSNKKQSTIIKGVKLKK